MTSSFNIVKRLKESMGVSDTREYWCYTNKSDIQVLYMIDCKEEWHTEVMQRRVIWCWCVKKSEIPPVGRVIYSWHNEVWYTMVYKGECRYSRYLKWYVLGTWKGVLYNTVMKSDALFCICFLVSFMADWQSSSGLLRVYKTLYISHHLKCSQRPECACSSSWRTQRFVFFKSTCKTSSPSVVQKDKLSNICIPSHMCPFGFCVD